MVMRGCRGGLLGEIQGPGVTTIPGTVWRVIQDQLFAASEHSDVGTLRFHESIEKQAFTRCLLASDRV